MQNKYYVEIYNNTNGDKDNMSDNETDNEEVEVLEFKTKSEMREHFKVPLYMIDKLIDISNNPDYKQLRKPHRIYKDFIKNVRIYLMKPGFELQKSNYNRSTYL